MAPFLRLCRTRIFAAEHRPVLFERSIKVVCSSKFSDETYTRRPNLVRVQSSLGWTDRPGNGTPCIPRTRREDAVGTELAAITVGLGGVRNL